MSSSSKGSLLAYLSAQSRSFHLRISLVSGDRSALEKAPSPFLTVNDTDPLTRMIEARFRSDAERDIEKAFLLVQRDSYSLTKDELWPVNNLDVEKAWQKAFSFYSDEKEDGSLIPLAGQLDEKGNLTAFPPLFFCKELQLFFDTPCPKCGLILEQCEDDDLLDRSGLLPYSGTLKRYLYCRTCASSGKLDFYVYETDHSDPPEVKDCRALIRKFKLLVESAQPLDGFPCIGCPNRKECYGPDQRASSRLIPFSFYPFHLFVFRAMTLNAADFLALLSGASFEKIESDLMKKGEPGRAACLREIHKGRMEKAPFLFARDEKIFLEVLYLKLSFLGEVFQDIVTGQAMPAHPDLRLSVDRIWVRLSEYGSLLPFLWNFRVKYIDIFRHHNLEKSFPGVQESEGIFFMGLVWFYTLLVNKTQDLSKIYPSLQEISSQFLTESGFSFRKCMDDQLYPTLLPENIFWEQEGKRVRKDWYPLWERCLQGGWSLLETGFNSAARFSHEKFLQQFNETREEVRIHLFSERPSVQHEERTVEDRAIHAILMSIHGKWQRENREEEALTETVVLSPGTPSQETEPSAPVSDDHDVLKETVIISSAGINIPAGQTDKKGEVPPETVIISSENAQKSTDMPSETEHKKTSALPPETVIMSTRDSVDPSKKISEPPGPEEKKKRDNDDMLTETVILKPGELQNKKKNGNK